MRILRQLDFIACEFTPVVREKIPLGFRVAPLDYSLRVGQTDNLQYLFAI